MKNINPLSKNSFRSFLHKRKAVLIGLVVMGFGVFMVGQTVPNNFFKKIFSPQKVSVVKHSIASKKNAPRIRVVKKTVIADAEKNLAQTINCPNNTTICLTGGNSTYTQPNNGALDATGANDASCTTGIATFTYTSTGSVNPATGSSLNGAVFGIGTSTVTWMRTDGCGNTATCSFTLTVYPPLIPGSINNALVNACTSYNPPALNVTGTSGGSGAYTYQWQLNGVNISGEVLSSYDPPQLTTAGTYVYSCVVSDNCGNSISTNTKTINIVADPIVTATGGGAVCMGGSKTLNASVSGGTGIMNFQWQSGPSSTGPWTDISGATNPTYSAPTSASGTFFYRVTLSPNVASCNNSSSTVTLVVNTLPTATITGTTSLCQNAASPNITFTGANGTAPYTFTYTINGGANQTITTSSGNSITVAAPTGTAGTFTYALVSVSDANTCSQSHTG
ncbi:MAG: HYR domain-containing protein, partial [Bacteroidetes bacterium]